LTGVLHRLVTQRLLQRRDDPADARRALFQLTARGRLVNAARAETVEAGIAAALRVAPAAERTATRRLLQRIASQLA
jgi:DNA-binding MarR family transcriptional regulator